MSAIVVTAAAVILVSLGGLVVYRLRLGHFVATVQQRELALAHEVVAGMREVALRLAADVNQHTTRVHEINGELVAAKSNDFQFVLGTVARLTQANEHLQKRLSEAEFRLQEHARAMDAYAVEARTDALTSLPNRHALDAEMALHFDRFQQYGIPLSIVIFDIDNFKSFNDRFGHLCGDRVLREIARVLQRSQRAGHTVSRFGGEEFVLTLPATTLDDAVGVAERARQAVQGSPLHHNGRDYSVTMSAGVAQLKTDEPSVALFQRADQALFAAKRAGRNITRWHDGNAIQGPRLPANADNAPPQDAEAERREKRPAPTSKDEAAVAASPAAASSIANNQPASACHQEPVTEPLFSECDRSRVFVHVRQRIAEWQRFGVGFAIVLLRVHEYDETDVHRTNAVRLLIGANLRDMDVVGRFAPDCYVLLLPRTGPAEAEILAERLGTAADQCFVTTKSGPRQLAVSLAAVAVAPGDDAVGILRRAETALMAAEKNRRCRGNDNPLAVLGTSGPFESPVASL